MPKRFTLKAARINADMRQIDVAERMGVAVSTVRNWEQGITYPKYPQIEMLCTIYDIPFDQIDFSSSE